MGTVGTSEGVARLTVQLVFDGFQVVFWDDDVRIEDDEVVALAAFGTVVARRAWVRMPNLSETIF